MQELLELRKLHGSVFVSRLPNGQDVPWRPLTVGEFLEYDRLLKLNIYPRACIEDEIFRLCVLSSVIVDHIDQLRAGIVTSVASDILIYSGPSNVEDLDTLLNISRHEASQIMHKLATTVTQAFPAYKPEEIYEMDYKTFILRVAQAEDKLLSTGFLQAPLSFQPIDQEYIPEPERPQPIITPHVPIEKERPNLKEQYAKQNQETLQHAPPIPKHTEETTIIKKADIMEHQQVMTAHDKDPVMHKQMADETANLYGDYLDQIKELQPGEHVVIKTPEERKQEALKRSAEHKKRFQDQKKQILKDAAEERKELLKIREKERERRRRRANRGK